MALHGILSSYLGWCSQLLLGIVRYTTKWIYKTMGHLIAASLESLAHCWNVAILSLFNRYYFGRCSSELAQLVPLPYSRRMYAHYYDRFYVFLSPFLDVTRTFISTVSLFRSLFSARLWSSLPIECFSLIYDLNDIKSRIDRH